MRPNPTDPQLGPALALVALRRENPDLPPLMWTLYEDGALRANVSDPAVFDAFRRVLGGDVFGPHRYEKDDEEQVSQILSSRWRDVRIALYGIYPAAQYDAHTPAAVKAVA